MPIRWYPEYANDYSAGPRGILVGEWSTVDAATRAELESAGYSLEPAAEFAPCVTCARLIHATPRLRTIPRECHDTPAGPLCADCYAASDE